VIGAGCPGAGRRGALKKTIIPVAREMVEMPRLADERPSAAASYSGKKYVTTPAGPPVE